MTPWTCPHCQTEQTHDAWCELCHNARYVTWEIQFAHHILEHLQDGLAQPLEILEAMQARPCYAKRQLELGHIARSMRLLTKDTTALARQIAKARSSRTMLEVLETGDTKDKIAVLKGIQVLGDVTEHKVDMATTVKHVYETAPPKPDA